MEKTVTLNGLKPNEYHLWVIPREATFEVHKCLIIILGKESNPTPMDSDGTPIGPIGEGLRVAITFRETRHALVRETLLRSLELADMLKVIPHQHSALAI